MQDRLHRRALLKRWATGPLALLAALAVGAQVADADEHQRRLMPDFITNGHNVYDDPSRLPQFGDAAVSHLEADIQFDAERDRFVSAHKPEEISDRSYTLAEVFSHASAQRKSVLLDLKASTCSAEAAIRLLDELR